MAKKHVAVGVLRALPDDRRGGICVCRSRVAAFREHGARRAIHDGEPRKGNRPAPKRRPVFHFGPCGDSGPWRARYETAVKGQNGFVCLVERSWDADFNGPAFWNATIRGADCLNPEAVRTVLPHFRERASWALAGLSRADMIARAKAEISAHTYVLPGPGAMAFMMSKEQRLAVPNPQWHPHLMFFGANVKDAARVANLDGSPVMTGVSGSDPIMTFVVPVRKWSDGTRDGGE